jgi:hypothetical protein
MMKNPLLVGFALLGLGACGGAQSVASSAAGLSGVAGVQSQIDKNCPADKVGPMPTQTPEQKSLFSDLIGQVLGGTLSKADFVSQLIGKNPGSDNAVKCAADQLPAQPAPATQPAPASK